VPACALQPSGNANSPGAVRPCRRKASCALWDFATLEQRALGCAFSARRKVVQTSGLFVGWAHHNLHMAIRPLLGACSFLPSVSVPALPACSVHVAYEGFYEGYYQGYGHPGLTSQAGDISSAAFPEMRYDVSYSRSTTNYSHFLPLRFHGMWGGTYPTSSR
jgi:hypothetical protein